MEYCTVVEMELLWMIMLCRETTLKWWCETPFWWAPYSSEKGGVNIFLAMLFGFNSLSIEWSTLLQGEKFTYYFFSSLRLTYLHSGNRLRLYWRHKNLPVNNVKSFHGDNYWINNAQIQLRLKNVLNSIVPFRIEFYRTNNSTNKFNWIDT